MDVIDQGMYCTLHIGGVVLSVCVLECVYHYIYVCASLCVSLCHLILAHQHEAFCNEHSPLTVPSKGDPMLTQVLRRRK